MEKTPLQQLIHILYGFARPITDASSSEDKWYRSGLREAIYQAKLLLVEEERVNNTDCVDGKKDASRRPSEYADLESRSFTTTTEPLDTKVMTDKKEQTAVDYLLHAAYKIVELNPNERRRLNEATEKAKEMEKRQIATAYDRADYESVRFDSGEQYYNETYGNDT